MTTEQKENLKVRGALSDCRAHRFFNACSQTLVQYISHLVKARYFPPDHKRLMRIIATRSLGHDGAVVENDFLICSVTLKFNHS